jgi:hypothetical protein
MRGTERPPNREEHEMTEMMNSESTPTTGLTREGWLEAAVEYFRPRFEEVGAPLPEKIHLSMGFGYGARAESKYILGQTWATRASEDGVNHVFLGPMEGDPAAVLVTLLHELIHVSDDNASGHRGHFAEVATRLGFNGPMTQTPPSIELTAEMMTLAEALGDFPHAKLDVDMAKVPTTPPVPVGVDVPKGTGTWKIHTGPAKQGTRQRLVICNADHVNPELNGYRVRMTAKWIELGTPMCPEGHRMVEADTRPGHARSA